MQIHIIFAAFMFVAPFDIFQFRPSSARRLSSPRKKSSAREGFLQFLDIQAARVDVVFAGQGDREARRRPQPSGQI